MNSQSVERDHQDVRWVKRYYERIMTEQDWSSNQFTVNTSEFSA